jgi:4-hydroxybenzoate polyprenyltransferase
VLRLLRPKQWTKNLLLFAALLFARKLLDPTAFATACLAFVSFCLASSSVYVVNDLVDVERDRLHPEKRDRPIASGRVGRGAALALAVGLATAALAVAAWISRDFALTAVVYMALSHFYSFVAKNVVILDTLIVAVGFVIRWPAPSPSRCPTPTGSSCAPCSWRSSSHSRNERRSSSPAEPTSGRVPSWPTTQRARSARSPAPRWPRR